MFVEPDSYQQIIETGLLSHPQRLWNFDWMTNETRLKWEFADFNSPTLPGLFPLAQDYTGDPYCWLQGSESSFGEPDILLCDHEDGFAWLFAPSVAGAIYRTVTIFAAAPDENSVAPMIEMIQSVIKVYGAHMPDDWVERLQLLSQREPRVFRGASVTKYALHTPWDCEEDIRQLFGSAYTEKSTQWANLGAEQRGGGQSATRSESR